MMAGLIRLAAALLLLGIASPAIAQDISISFGDQGSLAARSIQLIVLITLLSLVPGLLLMGLVGRWLHPHVPSEMKIPVALYVIVITGMLLCAGLTAGTAPATLNIAGAWGFAASDLAVARRQFVDPSPANALWGTPLYFGSQMVLATSIALA